MSDKLLSCPFCGGEAEYYGECDMVHVRCGTCGANPSGWWDESEDAAKDWNHRTPGWISVGERLPEAEGEYLVFDGRRTHSCGYNGNGGWWTDYIVTHWMPLPEPPGGTEP